MKLGRTPVKELIGEDRLGSRRSKEWTPVVGRRAAAMSLVVSAAISELGDFVGGEEGSRDLGLPAVIG